MYVPPPGAKRAARAETGANRSKPSARNHSTPSQVFTPRMRPPSSSEVQASQELPDRRFIRMEGRGGLGRVGQAPGLVPGHPRGLEGFPELAVQAPVVRQGSGVRTPGFGTEEGAQGAQDDQGRGAPGRPAGRRRPGRRGRNPVRRTGPPPRKDARSRNPAARAPAVRSRRVRRGGSGRRLFAP
ncbi:MAG: hypothetical protein MZV64_09555 [Ignavibacteriales bacterium]|nr:hypothetical protein [Ignavibacteriales bacterium]